MIWLVLALAMFAVAFVGIAWARVRARRAVTFVAPTDLAARIEAATRAFVEAPPWQPASDASAPAVAAAIESALIANDRKRALELAETALAASLAADRVTGGPPATDATVERDTSVAGVRVWLAWALVANGQPKAALSQLFPTTIDDRIATTRTPADVVKARIAIARGPLSLYVRARAEHLHFEHMAGASEPVPPLITTADLAVVTLASGRGAATWLKGTTEVQLSATQARAAIAEHRELTARCLAGALDALEAAPGFADAAYLVARLAVKAGLLEPARALFDALATRMAGRPDADAFERDRKDLADPATAVAAAKVPPPPTGKRSRSLKVLS